MPPKGWFILTVNPILAGFSFRVFFTRGGAGGNKPLLGCESSVMVRRTGSGRKIPLTKDTKLPIQSTLGFWDKYTMAPAGVYTMPSHRDC